MFGICVEHINCVYLGCVLNIVTHGVDGKSVIPALRQTGSAINTEILCIVFKWIGVMTNYIVSKLL